MGPVALCLALLCSAQLSKDIMGIYYVLNNGFSDMDKIISRLL